MESWLHYGLSPPALKDLVWRQVIHRFEKVTIFTGRPVQRDEHAIPTALRRTRRRCSVSLRQVCMQR